MRVSVADPFVLDRRFSPPGRRADTRARRREEQCLAEAMERRVLALVHAARWRLSDGAHLADEATPVWPRAFRGPSSAAAAVAATTDIALAEAFGQWLLAADHGGAARCVGVSLLLPAAMRRDRRLVDAVGAMLARSGLAPALLELRFAEAALLERTTETLLCLSALRDFGVGLAVDDFGRRYGSLSLLRDVPLTTVRLDPALTHDVDGPRENGALAEALVGVAHAMGMQVVAQGVDTAQQARALSEFGVDSAIGPAPRLPMPIDLGSDPFCERQGQGRCPWTPLGSGDPRPHLGEATSRCLAQMGFGVP